MSRAAASVILTIVRTISIISRVSYNVVDRVCDIAETFFKNYLATEENTRNPECRSDRNKMDETLGFHCVNDNRRNTEFLCDGELKTTNISFDLRKAKRVVITYGMSTEGEASIVEVYPEVDNSDVSTSTFVISNEVEVRMDNRQLPETAEDDGYSCKKTPYKGESIKDSQAEGPDSYNKIQEEKHECEFEKECGLSSFENTSKIISKRSESEVDIELKGDSFANGSNKNIQEVKNEGGVKADPEKVSFEGGSNESTQKVEHENGFKTEFQGSCNSNVQTEENMSKVKKEYEAVFANVSKSILEEIGSEDETESSKENFVDRMNKNIQELESESEVKNKSGAAFIETIFNKCIQEVENDSGVKTAPGMAFNENTPNKNIQEVERENEVITASRAAFNDDTLNKIVQEVESESKVKTEPGVAFNGNAPNKNIQHVESENEVITASGEATSNKNIQEVESESEVKIASGLAFNEDALNKNIQEDESESEVKTASELSFNEDTLNEKNQEVENESEVRTASEIAFNEDTLNKNIQEVESGNKIETTSGMAYIEDTFNKIVQKIESNCEVETSSEMAIIKDSFNKFIQEGKRGDGIVESNTLYSTDECEQNVDGGDNVSRMSNLLNSTSQNIPTENMTEHIIPFPGDLSNPQITHTFWSTGHREEFFKDYRCFEIISNNTPDQNFLPYIFENALSNEISSHISNTEEHLPEVKEVITESIKEEKEVITESIKEEKEVITESIKEEKEVITESIKEEKEVITECAESIKKEKEAITECSESTVWGGSVEESPQTIRNVFANEEDKTGNVASGISVSSNNANIPFPITYNNEASFNMPETKGKGNAAKMDNIQLKSFVQELQARVNKIYENNAPVSEAILPPERDTSKDKENDIDLMKWFKSRKQSREAENLDKALCCYGHRHSPDSKSKDSVLMNESKKSKKHPKSSQSASNVTESKGNERPDLRVPVMATLKISQDSETNEAPYKCNMIRSDVAKRYLVDKDEYDKKRCFIVRELMKTQPSIVGTRALNLVIFNNKIPDTGSVLIDIPEDYEVIEENNKKYFLKKERIRCYSVGSPIPSDHDEEDEDTLDHVESESANGFCAEKLTKTAELNSSKNLIELTSPEHVFATPNEESEFACGFCAEELTKNAELNSINNSLELTRKNIIDMNEELKTQCPITDDTLKLYENNVGQVHDITQKMVENFELEHPGLGMESLRASFDSLNQELKLSLLEIGTVARQNENPDKFPSPTSSDSVTNSPNGAKKVITQTMADARDLENPTFDEKEKDNSTYANSCASDKIDTPERKPKKKSKKKRKK